MSKKNSSIASPDEEVLDTPEEETYEQAPVPEVEMVEQKAPMVYRAAQDFSAQCGSFMKFRGGNVIPAHLVSTLLEQQCPIVPDESLKVLRCESCGHQNVIR